MLRQGTFRPRLTSGRGQTVVLFALLLPVFLGLGSIVLSIGNWYVHKRHLQTQVDAAVLAAAPAFAGCFFDASVANPAIEATALPYAGDTARKPTTANTQVQTPNNVHVVLNSTRYWQSSDGTDPKQGGATDTGYGLDNTDAPPCSVSYLDAKATDDRAPLLFPWLSFFPSPKTNARVEIRKVRQEKGMLPIAVPEIDPAAVYAIFVDYKQPDTQLPIRVQQLVQDPTYGGASFPYSAWVTAAGQEHVCIQCNGTSAGTGVVILVSKQDTSPSMSGTLAQVCGQSPNLVTCYEGSGGTGIGLSFIHSYGVSAGTPDDPRLRDVNLVAVGCNATTDLSAPYFTNEGDCTALITAKVDFGVPGNPNPTWKPSDGGICAAVSGLTYGGTSGTISTWTGTISLPADQGQQELNLSWTDKTSGTNCNNGNSGNFPNPAAVPYVSNAESGPVDYLQLSATGPNGTATCPQGSTVADANSVEKGKDYCYSVAVGLDRPLGLRPWNSPDFLLRFASKAQRKSGDTATPLNGALDCDHGIKLELEFADGCQTTYRLNYDRWGTPTCSTPTSVCWKDIKCDLDKPGEYNGPLPPLSIVNNPAPICVAPKGGTVEDLQHGLYDRFENPCTPNYWPTTQAQADTFFLPVDQGGHDFTNDPRYITLLVTDITAFSSPNGNEPVKYFAGFYATGWDVTTGGNGKPQGCYNEPGATPGTCGAPNNDAHPVYGCPDVGNNRYPGGQKLTVDNGDVWGHFVRLVIFSGQGTPSDEMCDLTSSAVPDTCVAVLTR